ncbi:MAG: retropepsin-like aspartic protease [Archangium sp.]|nr:retropepsin-like aspartic protease [Archangium sp.]
MHRVPLLLLVLCACRTITPAAPPPSAVWEAPIVFEAGGRPSALPLVQVIIGGQPALLVLDTGAAETTLQAWFVKSLEKEPTESEGHRVVELALQLGGTTTTAKWRLVETDPAQRELGIAGTLSPHHAVDKGAVAIDFPRKRLFALDGKPNAWLRWLDERSPKGQVEALPRTAPFGGRLHVMTRVGDGREVSTRLASGEERSSYAAGLFDAKLVADGQHVSGLHLRVGQSEFGPLDVLIAPVEEKVEGRLGMDVLRGTVLLVPVHELHPIWFMTPRE